MVIGWLVLLAGTGNAGVARSTFDRKVPASAVFLERFFTCMDAHGAEQRQNTDRYRQTWELCACRVDWALMAPRRSTAKAAAGQPCEGARARLPSAVAAKHAWGTSEILEGVSECARVRAAFVDAASVTYCACYVDLRRSAQTVNPAQLPAAQLRRCERLGERVRLAQAAAEARAYRAQSRRSSGRRRSDDANEEEASEADGYSWAESQDIDDESACDDQRKGDDFATGCRAWLEEQGR